MPSISVIISTYNQPIFLELVLYGYSKQTFTDFEIVIADDGSDERTSKVIEDFSNFCDIPILHVWQEDNGFQKTKILNKVITKSTANYLIFSDGDCIPRNDFVSTHFTLRKKGCALSGGYFKLNAKVSTLIDKPLIDAQSCFDKNWLLQNGQEPSFKMNKLGRSAKRSRILNLLTTTKATFDGMNVSCWKEDILEVNGFDERMAYGGEDREVGERMMNNGIRFKQIRYSAVCLHLFHTRPYKSKSDFEHNNSIRSHTKKHKTIWSPYGIEKTKVS